jgi:hypothetical protein
MIKRSIIVCLLALLAWHLAFPYLSRLYYVIPGQQRANYLRAQNFMHDSPADARVIVGSSIADRLPDQALGRSHVKLAFPGGGAFTGLEIIRHSGRRPPVLWIETNMIMRDTEADLLDNAVAPWRMELRNRSAVFKEEGRPSNFGVGIAKAAVAKACKVGGSLSGSAAPGPGAAKSPAQDGVMLEDVMKANRAHFDRPPDGADLAKRVERLAGFVDELTRAGCQCVFFEMPIDASLANLAEPAAVRKALGERFPHATYHWLEFDSSRAYQTSDGVHLVPADADYVFARMLDFEKKELQ